MCIKAVNAVVDLYSDVRTDPITKMDEYIGSFDEMVLSREDFSDGKPLMTKSFKVVTRFGLLGSHRDQETNLVMKKGKLDVVVRLARLGEEKQMTLDSFTIDVADPTMNICQACFPYLTYQRVTPVAPIELMYGAGGYVVKVLVKSSLIDTEGKYSVQAMHPLSISCV